MKHSYTYKELGKLVRDWEKSPDECTHYIESICRTADGEERLLEALDELLKDEKIEEELYNVVKQVVYTTVSTQEDEEATVIAVRDEGAAGQVSPDEDATVIATPDEDATVIATPDEDATVIAMQDDEATVVSPQVLSPAAPDDEATQLGAPAPEEASSTKTIEVGTILKERFHLVALLGRGGMGTVFKAIDMLKVEAKDRNPYLAIKVLNESFKQHADAFISLQREASKAQKLAHPNVATVYDFDRDGDTVYMTMELLEGTALNDFIKTIPEGGLPEEEALPLIEGLAAGLAYAHKHELVHSDFKPGNAFLMEDGTVKVLDFGIARAAKHSTDVESKDGETVFDPSSLGALTPAYATIEMFEGQDPSPSDDIYALACVAYELLTGRHPYHKRSAPKAKAANLTVASVDKLNSRQKKALLHALELTRDQRTETMDEFLDGIRRKKNYFKQIFFGTLIASTVIGAIGYKPVQDYYIAQELEAVIAAANSGPEKKLLSTLESLGSYPPDQESVVKQGIRDRVLSLYQEKIRSAAAPENDRYDYPLAEQQLVYVMNYYPDSAILNELKNTLRVEKSELLTGLELEYKKQLLANNFDRRDDEADITDPLETILSIKPDSRIFNDPRIEVTYYNLAQQARKRDSLGLAEEYLGFGNKYTLNSTLLANEGDAIKLANLTAESNKTISDFIEKYRNKQTSSLPDYAFDIQALTLINLDKKAPPKAYTQFLTVFNENLALSKNRSSGEARKLLEQFGTALPSSLFINAVSELAADSTEQSQSEVNFGSLSFTDLTASETIHRAAATIRLLLLRSESPTDIDEMQRRIAQKYNDEIRALFTQLRPNLAAYYEHLLTKLIGSEHIEVLHHVITTTQETFDKAVTHESLMAEIEEDKQLFYSYVKARKIDDAIKQYKAVNEKADDPQFVDNANSELALMFTAVAENSATKGNYREALSYLDKARNYKALDEINNLEHNYQREIDIQKIHDHLLSRDEGRSRTATTQLTELSEAYSDQFLDLSNRIARKIIESLQRLESSDLVTAHRTRTFIERTLKNELLSEFKLKPLPKPSALAAKGESQIDDNLLSAAMATFRKAQKTESWHYQVIEFKQRLDEVRKVAEGHYARYKKHYDNEKYQDALSSLQAARKVWKDNASYNREHKNYSRIMTQVNASGVPCREDIKGLGKRSRGTCYDIVLSTKERAPTFVVIPATSRETKAYAISKFEITVGQIDAYCIATNKCTPSREGVVKNRPMTNASPELITAYAEWLSKSTGFRYRLPTLDEWKNATSAAGREGNTEYNCRLRIGTQLIKGQEIVPADSGQPNNWGLVNYVGNVDEIVSAGKGYLMMGGNYTDSMSECTIGKSKKYNAPNKYAGFRLLRELI